jgi:hypothetical protein
MPISYNYSTCGGFAALAGNRKLCESPSKRPSRFFDVCSEDQELLPASSCVQELKEKDQRPLTCQGVTGIFRCLHFLRISSSSEVSRPRRLFEHLFQPQTDFINNPPGFVNWQEAVARLTCQPMFRSS